MIELTKGKALKFSELPNDKQEQLSFVSNSLKKGANYQFVTFAKFEPSGKMKESWYGIVIVDTTTNKQYQVGFNTLLGTAIRGSKDNWIVERLPVDKRAFDDADDLRIAVEENKKFKVKNFYELEVQVYETDKTKMKPFPIISLI